MRAVIDTNVVLAGLANRHGAAAKILKRFLRRQFEGINSAPTLDEFHQVLSVSQKVPQTRVAAFLRLLRRRTLLVHATGQLQVCKDPDDNKFLETALTGGADFIVTKNLKHFPRKSHQGIRIIKVADFLRELEKFFP